MEGLSPTSSLGSAVVTACPLRTESMVQLDIPGQVGNLNGHAHGDCYVDRPFPPFLQFKKKKEWTYLSDTSSVPTPKPLSLH